MWVSVLVSVSTYGDEADILERDLSFRPIRTSSQCGDVCHAVELAFAPLGFKVSFILRCLENILSQQNVWFAMATCPGPDPLVPGLRLRLQRVARVLTLGSTGPC